MPVAVVPFAADHLEPAAALLAARHRADQARVGGLPATFADPTVALPALEALLQTPSADAWVALDGTRLLGFLVGTRHLAADTTLMAVFADTRSVEIPFLGYGAVPDQAEAVYRALYAAAATQWVAAGFFLHSIRTTADGVGIMPWFALGFGQRVGYGVRPLDDVSRTTAPAGLPAPFV